MPLRVRGSAATQAAAAPYVAFLTDVEVISGDDASLVVNWTAPGTGNPNIYWSPDNISYTQFIDMGFQSSGCSQGFAPNTFIGPGEDFWVKAIVSGLAGPDLETPAAGPYQYT